MLDAELLGDKILLSSSRLKIITNKVISEMLNIKLYVSMLLNFHL